MELQAGNLRQMEGRCRFRPVPLHALHVLIPYSTSRTGKDYENYRSAICNRQEPRFHQGFFGSSNGPWCGRPFDRRGPPTTLFSPALALLNHDLEHLDALMPDCADVKFARSLIESVISSMSDPGERDVVLRSISRRFLEGTRERKGLTTGGTWLEETFAYPIIEIRRGGDPLLQGLVVYSKTIAQEEV